MLIQCALLLFSISMPQSGRTPSAVPATAKAGGEIDSELAGKLLKVKRIYVDSFGDDVISKQIQAMLVSGLDASKRFILTENKEKADAVLKGSTILQTHQELHASGDATIAGRVATADATRSTETINESSIAVRLVASDGDVVWTTTQESNGAKYKGANADVVDKVVKQLLRDLDKLAAHN
jgi:curli biogenesis system outer membrane secretion channel CsgG